MYHASIAIPARGVIVGDVIFMIFPNSCIWLSLEEFYNMYTEEDTFVI